MTEQLYLDDDALLTFEATVERTLEDRVVLDRTAFYPTGGGQPHDTGTIHVEGDPARRWRVTDVEKSDTIYHTLVPIDETTSAAVDDDGADTERLPPGTRVVGEVDPVRRSAHARYHTAQHLLSALLLEEFDAPTTGNQLYADHAHLDAAHDRFDETDLARIEDRLNELVEEDRPVTCYTMDRAVAESRLDAERTRIDLLPDSITELRIVEIGGLGGEEESGDGNGFGSSRVSERDRDAPKEAGREPYDRTACAGTHVGSTGEIGEVVVTGRETKGSDEERIRFAFADHR